MSYPPFALFYPNKSSSLPIDICGLRVNATHDLDARCFDNRSFLDFALWKYLKEGNDRIGEVIAPHPPCKKIAGTKSETTNVVVGMLKYPVSVTILNEAKDSKGKIIAGAKGTGVQLRNVLLVQNLPVPIHIGTKAEREIYNAVFKSYQFIMTQGKGNGHQYVLMDMTKEQFPERYREHPFWTSDVILMPPVMDPE